ncbi:MAG: hypothetical protein FIA97_19310, partial [Methylococcaceae bacterium]|nr:hypothetical protein [Methylococcaceae bacterium]
MNNTTGQMTVAQRLYALIGGGLLGLCVVAGLSLYQMNKVFEAANFTNVNTVPALVALDGISDGVSGLRVALWQAMAVTDKAVLAKLKDKIDKAHEKIDKGLKDYEPTVADAEDRRLLVADTDALKDYEKLLDGVLGLIDAGKNDQARDLGLANQATVTKLVEAFEAHRDYNIKLGNDGAANAKAVIGSSTFLLLAITLVTIALALGFGIMTLRQLLGQLGGEPALAAAIANRIAVGDLSSRIDLKPGDSTSLLASMKQMSESITALVSDALMLSKAAVEGKLATRADASKHQGDFRRIVEGVNQTLDAVIGPLNVAADYVDRIAKGAIPPRITDSYNGDFNVIKNNLNAAIDNVNALVADAGMLSKAAVEGKLATRADASKHQGDYRKIVEGVNQTLDAVIGPLNVAADYVDRIARGAIPSKITDTYNGDFNTIKNNLNLAIDNVNALVADAAMLAKAA